MSSRQGLPKILVSPRLVEHEAYAERRICLDVQWGHFIQQLGHLPVPVMEPFGAAAYLADDDVAAVLLTGGNDLSALSPSKLSESRDQLENELLDHAFRSGRPVVGVCRGAQLMASRAGLSLVEMNGHIATRHALLKVDESKASQWLPYIADEVNSYHRYCIQGEAPGVEVLAKAADGTVEAFVDFERRWLAIMWHPERETPFRSQDLELIGSFLKHAGEVRV